MSDTTTKKIVAFRVSWTADHEQYYQGHSLVFSDYTNSGQGAEETLRESLKSALDDLSEQGIDWTVDEYKAMLAELTGQVKDPAMLDWDIARAECPTRGTHSRVTDDADLVEDTEPDCAVCAGEWHFYVNVDVQMEENKQ